MRLKRLEIRNYKSLRDVVIEPTPLTVLVGPNASGKSNFADALDFLSEVYRSDLEGAVARKGGYENICFRQARRSRAPIGFRVVVEIDWEQDWTDKYQRRLPLIVDHSFDLRARSTGIGASFFISREELSIKPAADLIPALHVLRNLDDLCVDGEASPVWEPYSRRRKNLKEALLRNVSSRSELMIPFFRSVFTWMALAARQISSLRLFQLSPRHCREAGVQVPNPELDRSGGNLPAVIDFLKKHHSGEYGQLLAAAQRIMPSLETLETAYTHTKRLGLFLREAGFKRPWASEDISDGTIQAIALLAATFDPRNEILVIEEPENSVHPWAIRAFVEAFRRASTKKQIILTTHSPILIDQIRPEELWVAQRPGAETLIEPLLSLDPSLKEAWGEGKFTLSEYLDSVNFP
ncbi:MAG TPA: AAA family ATPase, partial [Thermoanaerobaculia bacterium]|nr:AAA family ATPase [Thermoanaerobaculia bacterium]